MTEHLFFVILSDICSALFYQQQRRNTRLKVKLNESSKLKTLADVYEASNISNGSGNFSFCDSFCPSFYSAIPDFE
jgi:hypothetical protein